MIPWDDIWSYVLVFGALVISAFGAPIPEEVPIIGAGVLVGHQWNNPDSWIKWWVMLPVCIAGVVACDVILYFIGRKWGTWLLKLNWVQKRILADEKRQKIEKNFHEYGIAILLGTRFLPGIRTPVFITAGVMRLPFRRFLFADGLYAIPGVNLLFWLAYWFTDQFERAYHNVEHRVVENRPIVYAVILAAVSGLIAYQYFIKRRVTTGDPKDFPVIGKKVAKQLHSSHLKAEENAPPEVQPQSTDQKKDAVPPSPTAAKPEHTSEAPATKEHKPGNGEPPSTDQIKDGVLPSPTAAKPEHTSEAPATKEHEPAVKGQSPS